MTKATVKKYLWPLHVVGALPTQLQILIMSTFQKMIDR